MTTKDLMNAVDLLNKRKLYKNAYSYNSSYTYANTQKLDTGLGEATILVKIPWAVVADLIKQEIQTIEQQLDEYDILYDD
jgi:hypothetical protein